MKIFEKIAGFIAAFANDPKTAIKELKRYGKDISIKSMPYILAGLIGVLINICGFRAMQNSENYIPRYVQEQAIAEAMTTPVPTPTTTTAIETQEQVNLRTEAEYCARVLYGTARNNTESGQKLVVWCIINRVEHQNYPNSVREVCQQKEQWMGYSDENPVLTNLYDISLEVLKKWHNNEYRDVSPDYIYMTWSSKEILLKDTFEDNAKTHYWGE